MIFRIPVSPTVRFEIFKRDRFKCQYCGSAPPKCVLELDHIQPVALGGENSEDNLLTSCFNCNRGKGARPLDVAKQTVAEKMELLAEKEAQLSAYRTMLQEVDERLETECWAIINELFGPVETIEKWRFQSVRRFLTKLPYHDVLDAARIAAAKPRLTLHGAFLYFCGIWWRKIKEPSDEA